MGMKGGSIYGHTIQKTNRKRSGYFYRNENPPAAGGGGDRESRFKTGSARLLQPAYGGRHVCLLAGR